MDADHPAEVIEIDSFSLIFPLPYRVAIIIVMGIWAWGLNLHYLHLVKIDVPSLIRYPPRQSATVPSHHLSTYRLAALLTIPLAFSLFTFWACTRMDPASVRAYEMLPISYIILLVIVFALPLPYLSRGGRSRTVSTLRRIAIGGIAEAADGKFGDILLADALTSYAKVLGDLVVTMCMFITRGRSATDEPDRTCGGNFLVPFVIAIPSLIRLRQCLIEFLRVRRSNRAGAPKEQGWGGQHLANALKYSSALPVIILSALQRGYDSKKMGISETGLFRLWLLAVVVNSVFSFYWDVAKDWDLSLFSSARESPEYPYGLRRYRYFHAPQLYHGAIAVDFLLRCTWSVKLSPHLDHFNDLEGGIFLMEALEVARRWIWIFFRVETEWVRTTNKGPAPDDILLSEYEEYEMNGTKYDED